MAEANGTQAITTESDCTAQDWKDEHYYCMTYESTHSDAIKSYVLTMLKLGLQVKEILTCGSLNFIQIHAPIKTLRDYATRNDVDFLCEINMLKDHRLLANMIRAHNPDESRIEPFKYVYIDYQPNKVSEAIYWRPDKLSHPFRSIVCLKLTYQIIESEPPNGYERIKLSESLYEDGILSDFFPIHDKENLKRLSKKWITWRRWPWHVPIHDIKVGLFTFYLL